MFCIVKVKTPWEEIIWKGGLDMWLMKGGLLFPSAILGKISNPSSPQFHPFVHKLLLGASPVHQEPGALD